MKTVRVSPGNGGSGVTTGGYVALRVTLPRQRWVLTTTLRSRIVHDRGGSNAKGVITSIIKDAIKLKTSPARLAQLLQNCCSPYYEGCNSCASILGLVLCFTACVILLAIAP